MSCCNCG